MNRTTKALLESISFLLVVFSQSLAVVIDIDYSFSIPERFGVATLESAKCCPYGILPDNFTNGFIPPTIYGIGVQKGGKSLQSVLLFVRNCPLLLRDYFLVLLLERPSFDHWRS